jgi:phosphate starvation-inducible protein PhoH
MNQPLTKREKRILRAKNKQLKQVAQSQITLKQINPKTPNQEKFFNSYRSGKNIAVIGAAGTGKTFLAFYLSLADILEEKADYKKLVIVRSAVPTRDIGFLKGGAKEKVEQYETPYVSICHELFNRHDAYPLLKGRGLIEFVPTSFIRGTTLNDCVIIFDEWQNCTEHEIDSVITRVGPGTKIIFTGDGNQNDLTKEASGFHKILRILKRMKSVDVIQFEVADVVRSGFVKDYLTQKYFLENDD